MAELSNLMGVSWTCMIELMNKLRQRQAKVSQSTMISHCFVQKTGVHLSQVIAKIIKVDNILLWHKNSRSAQSIIFCLIKVVCKVDM